MHTKGLKVAETALKEFKKEGIDGGKQEFITYKAFIQYLQ